MSLLDTIIKGSGNPIVLNLSGVFADDTVFSLQTMTDIEVVFGAETYTLLSDPSVVVVDSDTRLELYLQGTSETQSSHLNIKVFNAAHPRPLGYSVTSACLANLARPKICG